MTKITKKAINGWFENSIDKRVLNAKLVDTNIYSDDSATIIGITEYHTPYIVRLGIRNGELVELEYNHLVSQQY